MIDFLSALPGIITTIGLGALCTIYRKETSRIDELEEIVSRHVTDKHVRQILADKLDPIKEDLSEIKSKLDRIFDFDPNRLK